MAKTLQPEHKKYAKIGIIAGIVIIVVAAAAWGVYAWRGHASVNSAVSDVTADAVSAGDLRIAIIRMDAVQQNARVLKDVNAQRDSYNAKLKDELASRQKALEKEKSEIEKSQSMLSQEALQQRAGQWQQKVAQLQQDVAGRAQAIDAAYQKALADIQTADLDPIINAIIDKKNLSLVIDGRFARVSANAPKGLDITDDVAKALDKRITSYTMDTPKGF